MFEFEKEFAGLLREFHRSGALEHLVLIGSWCLPVYREHYPIARFPFTTSDIDFSVQRPRAFKSGPGIPLHELLIQLGYIAKAGILSKAEKYIPAPDAEGTSLSIEFLCEPGRDVVDPLRLPGLGIVVSPLSYQQVLLDNAVTLDYRGIPVKVPRPAVWAVHKVAVSQIREGKDRELKMIKDLDNAMVVLKWMGKDKLLLEAGHIKGKFRKLFQKGFQLLETRYEI
jgi:hypothetical protein